ncbi:MAG: hypothetical protein GY757_18865 [bacterium]|nr:hypothetical protein [bacterium]
MAITLIATVGASNANTYITLADAETYFESRLHKTDWDAATDANKDMALVWATRLLDDMVAWFGRKATDDQSLRWPQYSQVDRDGYPIDPGIVPDFLANAAAEFAGYLIGTDRTLESDTKGFRRLAIAGAISLEVDTIDQPRPLPDSVWQMVKWYGVKAGSSVMVDVVRV